MTRTAQIAKPVDNLFGDLNEEFDDIIILFVEETQTHLDRLVAIQSK